MRMRRDLLSINRLVDCLQRKDMDNNYLGWGTVCYVYNMNSPSLAPWVSKEHLQTFLGERITEDIKKILKLRKEA